MNPVLTNWLYSRGGGSQINPNIALGDELLTNNSITRAYWDFTNIDGDDWDVLTAHPDSSVNGTYNLINTSGGLTYEPTLGFFNIGDTVITTIRCRTSSGINDAFITSPAAVNLANGEREFHFLFTLQDGITGSGNRLAGSEPNGLHKVVTLIDASGKIYFRIGDGTNYSIYLSDSAIIANDVTDIHLLRVRMTTSSVTMMLDGVPVPCSLSAGVAISSVTLTNFNSAIEYGVGGSIGNNNGQKNFVLGDVPWKYIIKHAITDLLTDSQYLQLVASFNNFTSVF
jgi:hypothetical protein